KSLHAAHIDARRPAARGRHQLKGEPVMPNLLSRRHVIKAAAAVFAIGAARRARAQSLEPVTVMTPFGFIGDFIDLMNAYSGGHFKTQGLDAKVLGGH